jgi:hypothetical protein
VSPPAGDVAERRCGVGFAHANRDSDRLQQIRAALPAEVRVTAVTHPLFGRLLQANGFKRWNGELLLMVELPDGSPGTVPAGATDIVGGPSVESGSTMFSVEGLRRLHELAARPNRPAQRRTRTTPRK